MRLHPETRTPAEIKIVRNKPTSQVGDLGLVNWLDMSDQSAQQRRSLARYIKWEREELPADLLALKDIDYFLQCTRELEIPEMGFDLLLPEIIEFLEGAETEENWQVRMNKIVTFLAGNLYAGKPEMWTALESIILKKYRSILQSNSSLEKKLSPAVWQILREANMRISSCVFRRGQTVEKIISPLELSENAKMILDSINMSDTYANPSIIHLQRYEQLLEMSFSEAIKLLEEIQAYLAQELVTNDGNPPVLNQIMWKQEVIEEVLSELRKKKTSSSRAGGFGKAPGRG